MATPLVSVDVIADFYESTAYWMPLLALLAIGMLLARVRLLDFGFFVVLYASQYVVHSVLAFGFGDPITIFCIAFWITLMVFIRVPIFPHVRVPVSDSYLLRQRLRAEHRWIALARTYLVVYYSARLALYPFAFGELILDDRLAAQQENRILFFMGLAVWPAITAVFYDLTIRSWRLRPVDMLVLTIVTLGVLGSGSKAAVLPLLLTFIGVASFLGRRLSRNVGVLTGVAVGAGGIVAMSFYLLTVFFPLLGINDILSLLQFRIVANSDNLEYLIATGLRPEDYPFAGLGAIVPMLSKFLGYPFEYSPGVWLHGNRFADWRGFGPNSGLVMDYYGNLRWAGLLAAVAIGIFVRCCRESRSVVGCSFLSIAYFALMDSALFSVPLLLWGGVYGLILATLHVHKVGRFTASLYRHAPSGHTFRAP